MLLQDIAIGDSYRQPVNSEPAHDIHNVVLLAYQGADDNQDTPAHKKDTPRFIKAVMNGQAAIGRMETGKAVVRGVEPKPETIEEMGDSISIIVTFSGKGYGIRKEKEKRNEQLHMCDIENFIDFPILSRPGDDHKRINKVANINGNHERQKRDLLIQPS